jgi:hypothetical protein
VAAQAQVPVVDAEERDVGPVDGLDERLAVGAGGVGDLQREPSLAAGLVLANAAPTAAITATDQRRTRPRYEPGDGLRWCWSNRLAEARPNCEVIIVIPKSIPLGGRAGTRPAARAIGPRQYPPANLPAMNPPSRDTISSRAVRDGMPSVGSFSLIRSPGLAALRRGGFVLRSR